MKIKGLDHFNIVANAGDIERVIQFYCELLGFEEGPRPDFPFAGAWLYKNNRPLIHLVTADGADQPQPALRQTTTGCLHHLAFDCEGFDGYRALLEKHNIEYLHETVDGWNIEQLFLHDPAGMRIELNFKNG